MRRHGDPETCQGTVPKAMGSREGFWWLRRQFAPRRPSKRWFRGLRRRQEMEHRYILDHEVGETQVLEDECVLESVPCYVFDRDSSPRRSGEGRQMQHADQPRTGADSQGGHSRRG